MPRLRSGSKRSWKRSWLVFFRPFGAVPLLIQRYPGLAPWAVLFRRFAAWAKLVLEFLPLPESGSAHTGGGEAPPLLPAGCRRYIFEFGGYSQACHSPFDHQKVKPQQNQKRAIYCQDYRCGEDWHQPS